MEKETSSLVQLGIVLIAIAVVITLGFGIFAVGKRLANNGQNDLVSQVDQINQSTFIDLDQQVVTGTRLKGVINQLSAGNYAVLINTLALRNNQADGSTIVGDLANNIHSYSFVRTNVEGESGKGTKITDGVIFVNYNAVMKNSALAEGVVLNSDGTASKGNFNPKDKLDVQNTGKWDAANMKFTPELTDASVLDSIDHGAGLVMRDGVFTTEYEFMISQSTGNIIKNSKIADFTKQGTTMYLADAAQFNSYCIKDSTDNYVGMAFMQIKK